MSVAIRQTEAGGLTLSAEVDTLLRGLGVDRTSYSGGTPL